MQPTRETSNSAAGAVRILSNAPQVTVSVNGPPSMILGKSVDYTVVLTNEGQETARDLHVRLSIPKGVDVLQSESNHGSMRRQEEGGVDRLIWAVDDVPAHSRMELVLQLVAREGKPIDLNVDWIFRAISANTQICSPIAPRCSSAR